MTQAVLFDLDGTLADTAPDLGGALNTLLRRRGLPEKSMAEIRPVASHGAGGLILMGAGIGRNHPEYGAWREEYLAEYERCFDKETVLFDGADELITKLAARGIKWGIITNKPHAFTHRLVPKLGFTVPPAVVVSGDTCAEAKPGTQPMFYACEKIAVPPARCLYVGDAERDMQAGRNAGMKTVLAGWGYISAADQTETWPYDLKIARPLDLLAHL